MRRNIIALFCLCVWSFFLVRCSPTPAIDVPQGSFLILLPTEVDPALERLVKKSLPDYLTKLTGTAPVIQRLETKTNQELEATIKAAKAGVVLVLDAHTLAADAIPKETLEQLKGEAFHLSQKDIGEWQNNLGSQGATVVYGVGLSKLAKQYVVYEFLRRLGARFYHPEDEYLPKTPVEQLRERAKTPTIIAHKDSSGKYKDNYLPDYPYARSFSFHGAHPLAILEAFSDANHPIKEAVNVLDWSIKNRSNRGKGSARGVSSSESREKRLAELRELNKLLGFPTGSGITLHNQQQGADAAIDRTSSVPPKKQIEDIVTKRINDSPQDIISFGIHFGPTEFTTTPDKETIDWINWAGRKALELRPNIRVIVNNHISGGQPTKHFSDLGCPTGTNSTGNIDYYDLIFHADKRFTAKVHTVMFYPLEGPAFVYHQKTFSHKLCLMKKASKEGRPLIYFPEGSWWLSFDNTIPVYLPVYIWARKRDIDLLKPLLKARGKGTLDGHRMFNSGQEWGYWQQDYGVALWHWNVDISLENAIKEMFDPLCEPKDWKTGCQAKSTATKVMMELMEHQKEYFLNKKDWKGLAGGLFTYFTGEDPADEIGAATGFSFSPVRVSFRVVSTWNQEKIKHFRDTDMKALKETQDAYLGWLNQLKAIKNIPEVGKKWLQETIDGIEINYLRAKQILELYESVLVFKETKISNEDKKKADPNATLEDPKEKALVFWKKAEKTLQQATETIRRREKNYRYPFAQMNGGGFTPDTAVPNGTTYPWRVQTKTHHLSYWTNRHAQVKLLLDGQKSQQQLQLTPVFATPGTKLHVTFPEVNGLKANVAIGNHRLDETTKEVKLENQEDIWSVSGNVTISSREVPIKGNIVRSNILASSPSKSFVLKKPDSATAKAVLQTSFPRFLWAKLAGKKPALAFAPDLDEDGKANFSEVVVATLASDGETFTTNPVNFSMPVPNPATGEKVRDVGLTDVVFEAAVKDGKLQSPLQIKGKLSINDLAETLVQLAGFDKKGALQVLSGVLKFDSNNPPKTIDFEAEIKVDAVK